MQSLVNPSHLLPLPPSASPRISYTVIKIFFYYVVKLYFILMKFIFTHSGQIWINILQRVMRYHLFVEKRHNISRIIDKYKKSFICISLKHCYIPRINNTRLICDTYDGVFMTSLTSCVCDVIIVFHIN